MAPSRHRDHLEGGETDQGKTGGERQAARGRQTNPQPGEGARPAGHRDRIERGVAETGLGKNRLDHRHQRLGMAALHGLNAMRDGRGPIPHRHRARRARGIEREQFHGRAMAPGGN